MVAQAAGKGETPVLRSRDQEEVEGEVLSVVESSGSATAVNGKSKYKATTTAKASTTAEDELPLAMVTSKMHNS